MTLALAFGHVTPAPTTVAPVAAPGFNWIAFATQFAIAASYNISYAPYVSDYSRYLPKNTRRAKLIAVIFAGASLSGTWMIGLGAWLAQKLHAADALVAMNDVGTSLVPGLGKLIAIVSLVGFLPIIALNAYSAMLTVLTAADSIVPIRPTRRARVASIIAISTFVLACVFAIRGNGIALLQTFLTLMLYFLVPWTAVNLVDYFFVRHGHYAIAHFFVPNGATARGNRAASSPTSSASRRWCRSSISSTPKQTARFSSGRSLACSAAWISRGSSVWSSRVRRTGCCRGRSTSHANAASLPKHHHPRRSRAPSNTSAHDPALPVTPDRPSR